MIKVIRTPRHSDQSTYDHVSILFKIFCGLLILVTSMIANAAETGIEGTALWGPVKPGPARPGQSDEEPFHATFLVFAGEREVARFESDKKGQFKVLLPAGDYIIVPDKGTPIPAPRAQAQPVTVPADGFANITLRFDTGMR